ncbi:MAG: hypothetical protein GDA43_13525 [Hormoscilla sp. SP5CHS1]|nr:hypothetical protein [Hormoscilla sp. SP12CHS1]MBC6454083.1 hypothetical protein [Hormoscilla sp. SP5CHS1]
MWSCICCSGIAPNPPVRCLLGSAFSAIAMLPCAPTECDRQYYVKARHYVISRF